MADGEGEGGGPGAPDSYGHLVGPDAAGQADDVAGSIQAIPEGLPHVVALIGSSGTGKSHHAAETADRLDADAMIDDGLLIADGEILAGRSAKREVTSLAAVRRAIFADPGDARHLQEALGRLRPRRVLILGTSEHMIRLIAQRLGLPIPERMLRIEEIMSADDIAIARRTRREEGKHVIPAPTLQVKKTFPGYLVDPLRLLFSSSVRGHHIVEKSIVRPSYSAMGRISIASRAVAQVAQQAALQADPGWVGVLHTHVSVRQEGVELNLEVRLAGHRGPYWERLERLQAQVVHAVEEWTALSVEACEMTLREVGPRRRRPTTPYAGSPAVGQRPPGRDVTVASDLHDPAGSRDARQASPRGKGPPRHSHPLEPEGLSPHAPVRSD